MRLLSFLRLACLALPVGFAMFSVPSIGFSAGVADAVPIAFVGSNPVEQVAASMLTSAFQVAVLLVIALAIATGSVFTALQYFTTRRRLNRREDRETAFRASERIATG